MKGRWINTDDGPVHMDLADDATEEDVKAITEYIQFINAKRARLRAKFDQLYGDGEPGEKGLAWKWFKSGYELAEHRQGLAGYKKKYDDLTYEVDKLEEQVHDYYEREKRILMDLDEATQLLRSFMYTDNPNTAPQAEVLLQRIESEAQNA